MTTLTLTLVLLTLKPPIDVTVDPTFLPMPPPLTPPIVDDTGRIPILPDIDDHHRGMGNRESDVERWRPLITRHFPNQPNLALCVLTHESGGNPNAKNPRSSARGLFQILGSLWAPHYDIAQDDLYDPIVNVTIAADIQQRQGWRAWSAYNRGRCDHITESPKKQQFTTRHHIV